MPTAIEKLKSQEALELLPLRQGMPARIVAFQKQYCLVNRGMAKLLRTSTATLATWVKFGRLCPPQAVLLMDLLEQSEEARIIAGVYRLRSVAKHRRIRGVPMPEKLSIAA